MAGSRGSLIVSDGDLPALVAIAATARDGSRGGADLLPVAWIPAFGGAGGVERVEAARRQAELYGIEVLEDETLSRCGPGDSDGWEATVLLVRACRAAAARALETVIWPIHAGPELDLDRVARAVDRALLVSRLAGIDAGRIGADRPAGTSLEVRAPYADFTDDQIADLVIDMDLPVRACWWWEPRSDVARAVRERWGRALARVGWLELAVHTPGPSGGRNAVGSGRVADSKEIA